MRFGVPVGDERLTTLLRPGADVSTVITADVYGTVTPTARSAPRCAGSTGRATGWSGMIGHDFVDGERQGAKGYPRFTDPALRGPDAYAGYLREAAERSLERCGVDRFDVLMLHNPDHIGYSSAARLGGHGGAPRRTA